MVLILIGLDSDASCLLLIQFFISCSCLALIKLKFIFSTKLWHNQVCCNTQDCSANFCNLKESQSKKPKGLTDICNQDLLSSLSGSFLEAEKRQQLSLRGTLSTCARIRLLVFENQVLRRILGPKRGSIAGRLRIERGHLKADWAAADH